MKAVRNATPFMTEKFPSPVIELGTVRLSGCLRSGLSWFNWWISFAPEFQCYYFCESSCLFYLSLNCDFYVSKIMHL